MNQGRFVLLTYGNAVGDAMLNACSDKDSEDGKIARVASIIRKQFFSHGQRFDGYVRTDPTENTVPNHLLALVNDT